MNSDCCDKGELDFELRKYKKKANYCMEQHSHWHFHSSKDSMSHNEINQFLLECVRIRFIFSQFLL